MKLATLLISVLAISEMAAGSSTYYVSPSGDDSNPGTKLAPFKSFSKVTPLLQGGDTVVLAPGRYTETLRLANIEASLEQPVTVKAERNQEAVLDGTLEIDAIAEGDWEFYRDRIYRRKLSEDIWQLLVGDQDMIRARWPDASTNPEADNYIWGGRYKTSHVAPEVGTGFGKMVDSKLEEFPFSLDGAMMVLNQRYRTFSRLVWGHEAGSDTFYYDRDIDQRQLPAEQRDPDKVPLDGIYHFERRAVLNIRYYLEGKLEFLDAPGEWFYDKASRMLYVHMPNESSPEGQELRGKVKDFGLEIEDCTGVVIDGLKFFGSTFHLSKVLQCEIRNCRLHHYAANRRMLGEEVPHLAENFHEGFIPTRITARGWAGTQVKDGKATHRGLLADSQIAIENCVFSHGEGTALWSKANQLRVENCHFSYCDWSCSGKGATVQGDGWRTVYRRVEFEWCPRSETLAPGPTSLVELSEFGQKLGHGEEDGANVQVARHFGTIIRYCWFHSNRKFGPRFDGPVQTPERVNGRIHHNVCFDMDTISPFRKEKQGPEIIKVKGDAHWVVNNTLLNIGGVGIGVPGEWRSFGPERKLLATFNANTITRNNVSRLISSDRYVARAEAGETPAAGIVDHNIHEDAAQYLRDPANRDFRPRADSPLIGAGVFVEGIAPGDHEGQRVDIGAYQHDSVDYWIPGFQNAQASKPIPADGAKNAKADSSLIWLGGYRGKAFEIYIGSDRQTVEKANPDSRQFQGRQENNIFTPKGISNGVTTYWRVDTVTDSGTVAGPVWSFERKR